MKRVAFIAVFSLIGCALWAQTNGKAGISSLLSPSGNQPMVQEALESAIVRVSRAYLVRDTVTGEVFQRDGRQDFNEIRSFAIRVKGGLIMPLAMARPWEKDMAFNEYRGKYQGVASRLTINMPEGVKVMDSVAKMESCHRDDLLYCAMIDSLNDGLTVETVNGEVDGWLVLLDKTKDTNDNVVAIRRTVDLNKDQVEIENPKNVSNIEFGIFVRPVYGMGYIDFRLCGVVVDGKEKLTVLRPQLPGAEMQQIGTAASSTKPSSLKPLKPKGLVPVKPK